jgi:hypothetical protein
VLASLLVAAAALLPAAPLDPEPEPAAALPAAPASQTLPAPAAPQPSHRGFLLPMPFWLPETKAGLAVAAGRDFQLDGSLRASNALAVAAYSMEGQGSVDAASDVYLRGGSLVAARVRAVHYPDTFYGLGSDSRRSGSEEYTRRFLHLQVSGELGFLGGRVRAGPRLEARTEELVDVVPGGRLATSGLAGLHGYAGIGMGGSVTWDGRDHPLWPSSGAFAQAYYVRFPDALGRDTGFGKGAVDLRSFHPLGGGRVLGLSAVVETTDGNTPFTLLSKLGSARFFRGDREGRFRDAMVWAAQAELRVPLWRRLAGTVFGAVGDVAPDLALWRAGGPAKGAGGVGARWRLTDGGANLRVDVAMGSGGPEVYVVLLEAF